MTKSTTNKIIIIIIIKERKKKTQHTLYLLYSDIQNSVAYLYINNELSESGIKKTIHFLLHHKKDKTLRNNLKQNVEGFYTKPLRH